MPDRQEVTLRLYDALGRQVRTLKAEAVEGRQNKQLDVSDLSSGTYFLRLRTEGTGKTRRVTVVK